MAESWQEAWVEVLPDFKAFKNVANGQMAGILGGAGAAGGAAASVSMGAALLGGLKRIALPLAGLLSVAAIGTAIGNTIGKAINYALDSVDLASDLEQSTGAVEAVFKNTAGTIKDFAETAATNVGLTRSAFQTFATVVGAQLKNLGIPFDKVAGQTNELVTLGADLAAQFGGPTSDAVTAISALLRGERDPIERYGVSIKQVDINARLAAQGLQGLTGDALKQAQIQTTLAILYAQTADAQGTFARESNTLAGQQQRLNASLEDTQARLGEKLLPSFTKMAEYANAKLVPRLEQLIDRIGPKLAAAMEKSGPAFERLLDKVSPLVERFIEWAGSDGIPKAIAGLNEFVDHIPEWIQFFQDFDKGAQGVFEAIAPTKENLDKVRGGKGVINDWIQQNLVDPVIGAFTAINNAYAGFESGLGNAILATVGWFIELPNKINEAIRGIGDWLFKAGQDLIGGFLKGIQSTIGAIGKSMGGVMDFIAGFFPHSPAARGPFSGAGWTQIANSGKAFMDQFTGGMNPAVDFGSMLSVGGIGQQVSARTLSGSNTPAIYVQNPFTGEYLLSRVDGRASQMLQTTINRAVPAGFGGK